MLARLTDDERAAARATPAPGERLAHPVARLLLLAASSRRRSRRAWRGDGECSRRSTAWISSQAHDPAVGEAPARFAPAGSGRARRARSAIPLEPASRRPPQCCPTPSSTVLEGVGPLPVARAAREHRARRRCRFSARPFVVEDDHDRRRDEREVRTVDLFGRARTGIEPLGEPSANAIYARVLRDLGAARDVGGSAAPGDRDRDDRARRGRRAR